MATKELTHEQAMRKYLQLQSKLQAYVRARDEAERAFDVLKYGPERIAYDTTPEWKAVCKASGTSEFCDFGDMTC